MQKRILVVDDDTMNLVRTKMILEKEYSVLMADSGIEALERLKSGVVDLEIGRASCRERVLLLV